MTAVDPRLGEIERRSQGCPAHDNCLRSDVAYLLVELRKRDEALAQATDLILDLIDPDGCHYDHHGGCQAHGYLDLQPGELCPQLEAKAWAHNRAAVTGGGA